MRCRFTLWLITFPMRCCFKMTPMYNLMHPKSWRPKIIISWVPICQSSPCISEDRIPKTTLKAQNYYEIWEEVHLFKKLSMTQKVSSDMSTKLMLILLTMLEDCYSRKPANLNVFHRQVMHCSNISSDSTIKRQCGSRRAVACLIF